MSNSWLTNSQHTYMYKRLTVSQNVQMVNSRTVGGLWENCWLRVYRQMADRFWGVAVFQFYQGRFNTLLVMGNFHGLGIHRYSLNTVKMFYIELKYSVSSITLISDL